MKIATFGIVSNVNKKGISEVTARVVSLVPDGVRIVALEDTAGLLEGSRIETVDSLSGCDAVASLGGDGTFLRAARFVVDDEIPVLGIKIRSLGFLTEDDLERAVTDLIRGKMRGPGTYAAGKHCRGGCTGYRLYSVERYRDTRSRGLQGASPAYVNR